MRIVYVTAKNSGEAKKIAHLLLKKKLIACANIFPIESMYWWEGDIDEQIEFVILAKTKDENYIKVEKAIKGMHKYEIPAVYSWKVDKINPEYDKWVKKETK